MTRASRILVVAGLALALSTSLTVSPGTVQEAHAGAGLSTLADIFKVFDRAVEDDSLLGRVVLKAPRPQATKAARAAYRVRQQVVRLGTTLINDPEWACELAESLEKLEWPLTAAEKVNAISTAALTSDATLRQAQAVVDESSDAGWWMLFKVVAHAC